MNYWLHLFSPYTWDRFCRHGAHTTGFLVQHEKRVQRIQVGDYFVCYLVKKLAWCGVLQVKGRPFHDAAPIFEDGIDPYSLRLKVEPVVVLTSATAISVDELWSQLSRTRDAKRDRSGWAYRARLVTSPLEIEQKDGETLVDALLRRRDQTA
jgi:hypothetical protein